MYTETWPQQNFSVDVSKDEQSPSRQMSPRTDTEPESLHSKIWQKCPTVKFAGLYRVKFKSQVTVSEHNFRYVEGSV